ncbi:MULTISPECIES: BRO family protein [Nostoc]|uniref:DNA-damage-inducible protein n=1 Tax=Nostoc paludosum FACHB-159 TaxID=2692908 RepID=A0ABR8KQT7_9NOSO|nr:MULTISPECIES: BRO family protein [Nostoc]MBD2683568.1 DNA-damage-inducible protein [Nostoc sp. FACHB-857]MBD2739887.1 DNA-damage-inducible protein [Nostoc paludosum FACHB-159]
MDKITFDEIQFSPFDEIKQVDSDGSEFWLATELLTLLGYQTWKRIRDTVERAKISAKNSRIDPSHHLVDVVQMAQVGTSQAFREVLKDYKLSRHACYLVAMNGDPRKSAIAVAQNYFAVKTREAELAPQNSELITQLWEKLEQQNQVIEEQGKAIADLQAQVQNLLPPSADFMPPGWDAEVWRSLPKQDKRHFRFLYRRRNFRPSQENQPLALSAATIEQMKERQRAEVEQLIGEVSTQEKQQFQAVKLQKLREFWSQASVEEQKDMPF